MPPTAQAGHCCTPEQQAPTGRPKTPDTAKLLQRALASSSGSALLNTLSQGGASSHPLRPLPTANGNTDAVAGVAARSGSAQQPSAGPIQVPGPGTASVSACLSSATADKLKSAAMGSAASALAQSGGSTGGSGLVVGPLTYQEALSQQQAQSPVARDQSGRPQPAGADQQQQVEVWSASARQQQRAEQAAKWEQQPKQPGGQIIPPDVQAAPGQQTSASLNQIEEGQGHAAEAQQQQQGARPTGAGSSASITADLAGHVTAEVQLLTTC